MMLNSQLMAGVVVRIFLWKCGLMILVLQYGKQAFCFIFVVYKTEFKVKLNIII